MIIQKELYGLILMGGFSRRMGMEKALLDYHGIPQYQHLFRLLGPLCKNIFLSCRKEQTIKFGIEYSCILDIHQDIGPMNGLLSFFEKYPDKACLLVACDMPFIDTEGLKNLIKHRNPEKLATVYHNTNGLPEPLLSVWEPNSYPVLEKQFLSSDYSLRDLLKVNDIHSLKPENPNLLLNVNDPKALELVRQQLKIPPKKS